MKERRYIIVDENNRPMSWHDYSLQLCYNKPIGYSRFKIKTYTKNQAKLAIKKTITNRLKWNMPPGEHYLMPIDI